MMLVSSPVFPLLLEYTDFCFLLHSCSYSSFFNKKIKDISSCQLSKPIKGGEAHELGLVDALASPNDLVNTARQWALDIYELRRPWIKSLSGLRERFRDIK